MHLYMSSTEREGIALDGRRYFLASEAAADFGFSGDYIARLARHGKINGRRVGKKWYVEPESLRAYLKVLGEPEGSPSLSSEVPERTSVEQVAHAMHTRGRHTMRDWSPPNEASERPRSASPLSRSLPSRLQSFSQLPLRTPRSTQRGRPRSCRARNRNSSPRRPTPRSLIVRHNFYSERSAQFSGIATSTTCALRIFQTQAREPKFRFSSTAATSGDNGFDTLDKLGAGKLTASLALQLHPPQPSQRTRLSCSASSSASWSARSPHTRSRRAASRKRS